MALTCNIDARGKRARLIYGLILILIGLVLLFAFAIPYNTFWPWAITIFCLLNGLFGVFEARAGWCVVRAMGFRTRM